MNRSGSSTDLLPLAGFTDERMRDTFIPTPTFRENKQETARRGRYSNPSDLTAPPPCPTRQAGGFASSYVPTWKPSKEVIGARLYGHGAGLNGNAPSACRAHGRGSGIAVVKHDNEPVPVPDDAT